MSCMEDLGLVFDPEHTFFTSDTHFGHENIIKYCNRPFASAEEMDKALISNWNKVVKPEDTVFHLGDFAVGGSSVWNNVLYALNGKIYLIKGNHDLKNLRRGYLGRFEEVTSQLHIVIDGKSIYLNHFPFLAFGGAWREDPTWQLFGHIHSGNGNLTGKDFERAKYLFPSQYDVGVDNNNYTPISFRKVQSIIEKQIEEWKNQQKS